MCIWKVWNNRRLISIRYIILIAVMKIGIIIMIIIKIWILI